MGYKSQSPFFDFDPKTLFKSTFSAGIHIILELNSFLKSLALKYNLWKEY